MEKDIDKEIEEKEAALKKKEEAEQKSLLEIADEKIAKLEELNKKFDDNMKRQEKLIGEQKLQGRSVVEKEEKPKEETPEEYTKRVMSNQDGEYGSEEE